MAYFEERDYPEIHGATFYISDDSGNRAALKARQAYELLQWLYERRDKLWQLVHPGLTERSLPTWLRKLPEWATEEEQSTDSDANAGENGVPSRLIDLHDNIKESAKVCGTCSRKRFIIAVSARGSTSAVIIPICVQS